MPKARFAENLNKIHDLNSEIKGVQVYYISYLIAPFKYTAPPINPAHRSEAGVLSMQAER